MMDNGNVVHRFYVVITGPSNEQREPIAREFRENV